MNTDNPRLKYYVLTTFLLFLALSLILAFRTSSIRNLTLEDIYYSWLEGDRLTQGENPYSRIHQSDLRTNDKYATYFPLFYEFSYLSNLAGFAEFSEWVKLWRVVFIICNIGIATLIFLPFFRKENYVLALFASGLWLFNRWTLYVTSVVHLDFFAILFFLFSLALLPRRKTAAFISLSISLAIKQIAIFTIPLYVIWAWQLADENKIWETAKAVLVISLVPAVSSLPFIFWDFSGLIKSIFFSATRVPDSHFVVPSVDAFLGLVGIPAKLPMGFFLLFVFFKAWDKKFEKYLSTFLTIIIFLLFNSVFFAQYMSWAMALLPLVIYEHFYPEAAVY
jgi:hypothetical protein